MAAALVVAVLLDDGVGEAEDGVAALQLVGPVAQALADPRDPVGHGPTLPHPSWITGQPVAASSDGGSSVSMTSRPPPASLPS